MSDAVLDTVRSWSGMGVDFALATVVGVRGSTYRGLAARQILSEDGASVGTVSGGCLDTDLRQVAAAVMESGEARRVEFDLTADDEAVWGWGVGCNGATDLLVEPARSAIELAALHDARPKETFCIAHPVDDPDGRRIIGSGATDTDPLTVAALAAIEDGRHAVVTIGGADHLLEVVGGPRRVVVFGAGHDAVPMVTQAAGLGFDVLVVDDRRQFLTHERFAAATELIRAVPQDLARVVDPDHKTSVVLMSHNYLRDLDALRSLLGSDVGYIGALGPGERLQRMLDDLAADGVEVSAADLAKMHGPAGLDIGAEGPAEIALSVLSEIISVARTKAGGPLRTRKGPTAHRV